MSDRLTELTAADQARVTDVLVTHGRYIEAVAAKFAPSHDLVPDVVQQVSMKLCQSLHTFRKDANIRTWLFSVTRNEAVNIYRKERRVEHTREHVAAHTVDDVIDIEETVIDADERNEQRRIFHRGLREALTPRQREAVRNMITPRDVPVSRDRASLTRARQRLRAWVARDRQAETDESD